ncbi:12408_t:CDS:2, partial [Cetraspora pellucida]
THKLKEVENFIYFGVETVEYNSVISLPNAKMQMMKLIKFSQTDKLVIETTDIEYIKTLNYNVFRSSSLMMPRSQLIIDIVVNNVKSTTTQTLLKYIKSATYLKTNLITNSSHEEEKLPYPVCIDSDDNEQLNDIIDKLINTKDIENNDEDEENSQFKK